MKDLPLSNLEQAFVLAAVGEGRRLDGRAPFDIRHLKLTYGLDFGCAQVTLGDTRIMAQVSSKMSTPKDARPAEGLMRINIELSPMAAPEFEANRPNSDLHVEISRILERLIKESKCVDLEALCILSGEKVWDICIDIHVLNHQGNLIDAASIAAMAALLHFKRPDVTVSGDDVTIHTFDDKAPISLSVHHIPICTTFAFMEEGKYMVVDPTDLEEKTMDGKVVVGMNVHQEICCLQMAGKLMLEKEQVIRCTNIALVKVNVITEQIKSCLAEDVERRAKAKPVGFAADLRREKTKLKMEKDSISVNLKKARKEADEMMAKWREEGDEEEEEDDDEEEEEDGDEEEEGEGDEEESETDSEESETDSEKIETRDLEVQESVPNAIANGSLSDNGSLTDSLSVAEMMNQKKSLNIGEGGPSQWAQDKTDRTQKKGDDSSDSEEEEVVQLTSTEVD